MFAALWRLSASRIHRYERILRMQVGEMLSGSNGYIDRGLLDIKIAVLTNIA
jgi:hypothetical protein